MSERQPRQTLCVAATFTADPLQEPLEFWWRELGADVDLGMAPYGQLFQQLLDPGGVLRGNGSGANVLLVRWEDLAGGSRPGTSSGDNGPFARVARELVQAIEAAAFKVPTLVALCPARDAGAASGEADATVREGLASVPGVSVMGPSDLDRLYPVQSPHDEVSDRFGHVPFTPAWFAAAGTAIARWHRLATERPRKVVVLDCDNTLWGGVVGEEGPRGLRVDGPWEALQRFMVRRSESGRLLCLCSKNGEADVLRVFDERPEMPLGLQHIVAHRISSEPKLGAVRELARELDLGLDSFVFIDDGPVECAEMRSACPEMPTLQLPREAARIRSFLEHAPPLEVGQLTEDDRRRSRTYADNARRPADDQAPGTAGRGALSRAGAAAAGRGGSFVAFQGKPGLRGAGPHAAAKGAPAGVPLRAQALLGRAHPPCGGSGARARGRRPSGGDREDGGAGAPAGPAHDRAASLLAAKTERGESR